MNISIHTDGASRGNPGPAAVAYTIEGLKDEPIEFYRAIGSTTNNQAEYQAMQAAVLRLEEFLVHDATIEFFSDSELMVKQLRGEYKVKDQFIKPLHAEISAKLDKLGKTNSITLTAVRREYNKRADFLANCALDGTTP